MVKYAEWSNMRPGGTNGHLRGPADQTVGRGAAPARRARSHEKQYYYVLQSLTLWREIAHDMFRPGRPWSPPSPPGPAALDGAGDAGDERCAGDAGRTSPTARFRVGVLSRLGD